MPHMASVKRRGEVSVKIAAPRAVIYLRSISHGPRLVKMPDGAVCVWCRVSGT